MRFTSVATALFCFATSALARPLVVERDLPGGPIAAVLVKANAVVAALPTINTAIPIAATGDKLKVNTGAGANGPHVQLQCVPTTAVPCVAVNEHLVSTDTTLGNNLGVYAAGDSIVAYQGLDAAGAKVVVKAP
ncbi:hypothetical protein RQP46_000939 [Phenoliferia psychrophenolica]